MMRSVYSLRSLSVLAAVVVTLVCADVASAQEAGGGTTLIEFTPYIGIALTVIGSAFGISRLAASAYESMSRQPEVAGSVQTAMIIAAALIEGFTFYALFLCTPS